MTQFLTKGAQAQQSLLKTQLETIAQQCIELAAKLQASSSPQGKKLYQKKLAKKKAELQAYSEAVSRVKSNARKLNF